MTTLTQTLADFTVQTRFDDLPQPVVHEAKRLLLDTIGCALGAIDTPSGQIALDYVNMLGGTPHASVIGSSKRSSATAAAYANARLANVLDADDTFPTSTHFGNATVFSALALAELQHLFIRLVGDTHLGVRQPIQVENFELAVIDLDYHRCRVRPAAALNRQEDLLVRLMHDLGLRRGEVVALDLGDLDLEAGTVAIVGKGKSEKTNVTLNAPTAAALR